MISKKLKQQQTMLKELLKVAKDYRLPLANQVIHMLVNQIKSSI